MHCCCVFLQIKVERMAQESRVQKAIQEQEKQFGKMTRSISGTQPRTTHLGDRETARGVMCPCLGAPRRQNSALVKQQQSLVCALQHGVLA